LVVRGWGIIAAVCMGCTALNPAFDLDADGSGDGSAENGEGSATSAGESDEGGSSESGEIPLLCPPFYDGLAAMALVTIQDGNGADFCGGTLTGRLWRPNVLVENEYELQCDATCGACEAGPYPVVFVNGDPHLGDEVPCVQIFMAGDTLPGGCTFSGMGILDDGGAVLYGAGTRDSLTDPLLSAAIPITAEIHEPCRCEGTDCCAVPPGSYRLVVTTDSDEARVAEGEVGFVTLNGREYELETLRAHAHQECGGEAHFDWVAKLAL
jgi:hypothetical protein